MTVIDACTCDGISLQVACAYFGTKGGLCNDSSNCGLGLLGEVVSPIDARRGTVGRESLYSIKREKQTKKVTIINAVGTSFQP